MPVLRTLQGVPISAGGSTDQVLAPILTAAESLEPPTLAPTTPQ